MGKISLCEYQNHFSGKIFGDENP
ncbi:hypothetical protein F383_25583 [Gossypium arboreum]|uniref:Uncharacterized protein n=1 Tax=Gossypium arboreum TaxID=29729 RepID=A0A0B0P0X3_GOSAR|nr:hypothetical protein F383_25583 [Gossypium arboreum]